MSPSPNFCTVIYSCEAKGVAPPFGCEEDGLTTFDSADGTFTFTAGLDLFSTYPPGQYEFTVTGTVGTTAPRTASVDFVLVLKDLCADGVSMSIIEANVPFVDATYQLGDAA